MFCNHDGIHLHRQETRPVKRLSPTKSRTLPGVSYEYQKRVMSREVWIFIGCYCHGRISRWHSSKILLQWRYVHWMQLLPADCVRLSDLISACADARVFESVVPYLIQRCLRESDSWLEVFYNLGRGSWLTWANDAAATRYTTAPTKHTRPSSRSP